MCLLLYDPTQMSISNYWLDYKDEAERVLQLIIDWGRYAELFTYDYGAGVFSAENPREETVES